MHNTELPPYDAFYSKLRNCNLSEVEITDYVNLLKERLTTEKAVVKLKLLEPPPSGVDIYQYLQQMWKQEQLSSFKDFLGLYSKKDVVPTSEGMQKMIAFHNDKDIDMLNLGCILPKLANNCLHKSTDAKLYPFTEGDENLLKKIREDVAGGPSIASTRKAFVDETFIRKSTNICKSTVEIDASQLSNYSMCQLMPTGLYSRWDFDSEPRRITPRQNKTLSFEKMVMSYSCFTTFTQLFFYSMVLFSLQNCVSGLGLLLPLPSLSRAASLSLSLTEEKIRRGSNKRELDALRRHYIHEKSYKNVEMCE